MVSHTVEVEHRQEVEDLMKTLEEEGWQVKRYDVYGQDAGLYVDMEIRKY